MTGAPQEHADLFSVITTLVVFGMITVSIYYVLLRPILSIGGPAQQRPETTNNGSALQRRQGGDVGLDPAAGVRRRRRVQPELHHHQQQPLYAAARLINVDDEDNILNILASNNTAVMPSHVNPARQATLGGSNLLVDGLVPFRHSRASLVEQELDQDEVSQNRKDRARVLARLLGLNKNSTGVPSAPPARGSTVVVSLHHDDVDCSKLRRVLYLLGTYYNLMVMLDMEDMSKGEQNDALKQSIAMMRGDNGDLPAKVLPDHRVVAAQSVTGRVAFVRQLARVEFVLDFDPSVKSQLGRFGFNVYIYDDDRDSHDSALGNALLP